MKDNVDSPSLSAQDSTYQAEPTPMRSEIVLPRAAAAIVLRPSRTPESLSVSKDQFVPNCLRDYFLGDLILKLRKIL